MKLRDQSLLRQQAYFDGTWCDSDDGAVIVVTDPATGERVGTVPKLSLFQARAAIEAAHGALPSWRSLAARDRAVLLRRWHDLMVENADDLALILTSEQGKPLAEAHGEIMYASSFVEWFGEEAKRVYGDIIPSPWPDKRITVHKEPIGVCAAITPWNFPAAMVTRKAAAALAAGCTMVVKPASQTPLTALALAVLAERAGIPAGVLSVITGQASMIGTELATHSLVRKVSFTGSTEIGRVLMAQGAATIKKLSLELGGNAPFIVFDDADIDAAVQGALVSKFRNAGQTCVCSNRFYVQRSVQEAFATKLAAAVTAFKVGAGVDAGVQIGPLIDAKAMAKVQEHVQDALDHGAKLLVGGKPHALGLSFYEPTVLTDANQQMKVAVEETFGPLAAIIPFDLEEEVIALANDTEYGLASYFYSRDIGRVIRVSEQLEFGMVGVNTGAISTEVAPFGGVKQSGLGREGSKYGIEDYLVVKYVCTGL